MNQDTKTNNANNLMTIGRVFHEIFYHDDFKFDPEKPSKSTGEWGSSETMKLIEQYFGANTALNEFEDFFGEKWLKIQFSRLGFRYDEGALVSLSYNNKKISWLSGILDTIVGDNIGQVLSWLGIDFGEQMHKVYHDEYIALNQVCDYLSHDAFQEAEENMQNEFLRAVYDNLLDIILSNEDTFLTYSIVILKAKDFEDLASYCTTFKADLQEAVENAES